MLRSLDCWVVTDVSGQPLISIFTLEDGARRFSRNAGNYQSMLSNIPEYRRSHCRTKLVVAYSKVLSRNLHGGVTNTNEKPWQS